MNIEQTHSSDIISLAIIATIVFRFNYIRTWSLRQPDLTEIVSVACSLNSFANFLGNTVPVDDI